MKEDGTKQKRRWDETEKKKVDEKPKELKWITY